MRYSASFSCKVGNYSIQWRKGFTFREDAVGALRVEHEGIKRHFGEENVKEFKGTVHKVKD